MMSSSGAGDMNGSNRTNGCDDMLTTPVLTTPNTADLWNNKRDDNMIDFSPENLSSASILDRIGSELDLPSRDPAKDLPLGSDIGLRSPCDGLLAKRRKQMREMSKRAGSFNSDSNSCDTPTSENSPRDLTTGPPKNPDGSEVAKKRSTPPNYLNETPSTSSFKRGNIFGPASPRGVPPLLPPPSLSDDRRCKEFKKPANLQVVNSITKENDIPAHYTPSPLAVPSPNWSVVERYFGGEIKQRRESFLAHQATLTQN